MDKSHQFTRRRAIGVLAGATAATIAGCSSSPSSPAPSLRKTSPGPSGSTGASPSTRTVQSSDFKALKRKVTGDVYRPGHHGYDEARLLFDRRFDASSPAVVVRAASEADVAQSLAFAQHLHLPISLRSGGHSYIGASTGPGMVIDVRGMTGVTVGSGTATVAAGTALIDVYSSLAAQGVSIPAGSCPTVGVSGLALGGGIGVVGRKYGLTCDRLTEARVVTAGGNVVTCNASEHSDLYWALRGGGGSFGVVTSLTFGTHPTEDLAHAFLAWPWSAAADVVAAWQSWAVTQPKSLWSAAHVLATSASGAATVSVAAVMVGSTASLQQHLGQLTQAISTSPTTNFVTSESYAATMLLEAGCAQLSVQQCHVADETPGGTLPRDAFVAGSDFFADPIPAQGIAALVKAVEHRQSDSRLGAGGASFDVLGGEVDALAAGATAWVHRGALFDAQYTASWGNASSNQPLARNQHSLAKIHNAVRPYARGDAYQNYADDTLANPQKAYYGANLAKLIDVRRTYDPSGVFTQPQGVPLT